MKRENMTKHLFTYMLIGGAFVLTNPLQAAVIWDTTTTDGSTLRASDAANQGEVNNGLADAASFIVPNFDSTHYAWIFNSVSIKFDSDGTVGGTLSVEIWSDYPSLNAPDNTPPAAMAFTTTATYAQIAGGGTYTFTPSGNSRLEAGTYWLVLRDTGTDNSSRVLWTGSAADGPAYVNNPYGGIGTTYSSQAIKDFQGVGTGYAPENWLTSSADWIPLQFSIDATVVPEPATYGVIAGLALLGFAGWRRFSRQ
jgi:hypothetical protein